MKARYRSVIIAALLLGAVSAAAFWYGSLRIRAAESEAEAVLSRMEEAVPELIESPSAAEGAGKGGAEGGDPLAVMSISGVDVVGCIEVPALGLRVPVTAKGIKKEGFARYVSGSPVRGRLRIFGGRRDAFGEIDKVRPGERAVFTDMEGARYTYGAVTQFHLKKWDRQTYDLMLCYRTDGDTSFVAAFRRI